MSNKGWMVVCLLLTLLAGTSAGVVADRVVWQEDPKPPPVREATTIHFTCEPGELEHSVDYHEERRRKMLQRWQDRFTMNDEQLTSLDGILRDHGTSAHDFWTETRDRYCGLRDSLRTSVRSVLDEQQEKEFEAYLEERRERRRSSGGATSGSFL